MLYEDSVPNMEFKNVPNMECMRSGFGVFYAVNGLMKIILATNKNFGFDFVAIFFVQKIFFNCFTIFLVICIVLLKLSSLFNRLHQ